MRRLPVLIAFVAGVGIGVIGVLSQLHQDEIGVMRWRWSKLEYFPPLPFIVASQDLPAGTVLNDDLLAQRRFPEEYVNDGVPPEQIPSIRGLTALTPLVAGEPVRHARLGKSGTIEAACSELVQAVNAKHPDVAREKLEAVRTLVPR